MGGACSTHGRDEKFIHKMGFIETGWEDVGWIRLAQDRVQWRALMNNVLNFWVP